MSVIYAGPSLIDGVPIVAIARPGKNVKIGNMLCTWIMLRDVAPHEAAFDGQDSSVCGSCRYRGDRKTRACYVRTHLEPRTIWEAYKRGVYPVRRDDYCLRLTGQGQVVRVGSYGDPAAVPIQVWEKLISEADRWTGYTHLWRSANPDLRRICMASVDDPKERAEAAAAGWRTFHVVPYNTPWASKNTAEGVDSKTEILCPGSREAGRKTTCEKCRLCMGTSVDTPKSIWEYAHGPGKENHVWEA